MNNATSKHSFSCLGRSCALTCYRNGAQKAPNILNIDSDMVEHNENEQEINQSETKTQKIMNKIKLLYKEKILPLEKQFQYEKFHSPSWTDADFDSKPMVLLMGCYSTGKTSFIRYLLDKEFAGSIVGPEPTTDKFTVVMYGQSERIIPGNALAVDRTKPFTATARFGLGFLDTFQASICESEMLKNIIFVDTPGVLSGEKQRIKRSYNFSKVAKWFATRSDRILLLFDAHKLDIPDEFRKVIEILGSDIRKVRCVLNKADMRKQDMLRVYGALMWSLGKVIETPEVLRVYIGSFWSQPMHHLENLHLIKKEMHDLICDLQNLSQNSCLHRINEFVKRSRMCQAHAYIISHLRDQFGWFNKEGTQDKLLQNLKKHIKIVETKTNLSSGDFPDSSFFQNKLINFQIWKFPKLNVESVEDIDNILSIDIPRLLENLHEILKEDKYNFADRPSKVMNPFENDKKIALLESKWVVDKDTKEKYEKEFFKNPLSFEQKLSAKDGRAILLSTGIPSDKLHDIWDLADIDGDGMLDCDEFAVAMFLINQYNAKKLNTLPTELKSTWIPPSKFNLYDFELIKESDEK